MIRYLSSYICLFLSVAAGGALAATSLHSISLPAALWGWFCAFLIYEIVCRSNHVARSMFVAGFVFHAIAFYWLSGTLDRFGGFGPVIAFCLFMLFCAISSLQFMLFGWLCSKHKGWFGVRWMGVGCAASWCLCEVLIPRLFPWTLSSSQIYCDIYATHAASIGVSGLSFVMLIVVAACRDVCFLRERSARIFAILCLVCFGGLLILGQSRVATLRQEVSQAPRIRVAIVQGNLSTKVKGKIEYLEANLDTYRRMTYEMLRLKPDLVVWPETVSTRWMPHGLESLVSSSFDVYPDLQTPLLFGALTYEERTREEFEKAKVWYQGDPEALQSYMFKRYNSAVGRRSDGGVAGIFSKRALMPLGEYLPFEDWFPFVRKLSPQSASFSVGDEPSAIRFERDGQRTFVVAPLICYEDLVPSLSQAGVRAGAQVLVNLTNDAWYGDTAAPYQHNLLAAWRAVETGRYLLRVTNTGLTAVINPLGEMEQSLPTFSEGSLLVDVPLLGSSDKM